MPEKKTSSKSSSALDKVKKTVPKKDTSKAKTATKNEVVAQENAQNPYLVPASIVVAGALMALALFFSGGGSSQPSQVAGEPEHGEPQVAGDISFMPISEEDHIFGDSDAPIKVIEYADFNCGFCQRVHTTLEQLVENNDGQVAWVHRHFPVLGDLSVKKAEAAECVAELGGNDAFWEFADLLYSDQYFQATEGQLAAIAAETGVNRSSFESCMDSGRHADKVQEHGKDAANAGGRGTPYSVVVGPNGDPAPVSGAQPLSAFQAAVDSALGN